MNTSQIVDQILPKFVAERELSAVGGDGGEAAIKKNLNPFKRKTEAPVVYWSGLLDTDTTPRMLTYQIPDYFNGSLRVMAVAVALDAIGSAAKTAEVRGYFVINPNVPTFVAPGDEFNITAGIANNVEGSGANANVAVELTASSQLEIIGTAKQNMVIPEGQERSVTFKLRAKSKLGSAELNFIASANGKSSKMSSSLSVRPSSAYSTQITSGYTKDLNQTFALNRVLYPEYKAVGAAAGANPLILVSGLERYLNDYPYGCVEQLVSKAFPWLAMAKLPRPESVAITIREKIQKTIQMLSQRQMTGGAFNYWPEVGTTQSNDFASVYAMHFLTEAKEQGYIVPSDVFSTGISFLKEFVTQPVSTLDQARIHAYAIYILTRNEIVTTNYLTNLQLELEQNKSVDWHNDIISAYIASIYQMLKNTAEANKIINYFKPDSKTVNFETDFYNQHIANAQYVYLIARHFPEKLPQIDINIITSLASALNSDAMSTILAAESSLALGAYNQNTSLPNNVPLSIKSILADNKQAEGVVNNAEKVVISNPSKQGFFYQLTQAGFDKNLPTVAFKQGIEVFREYSNANVSIGDELIVTIRVRSIDNLYHSNIAIVDLLPGGFEVVRDSLKNIEMDYVDIREDRVIFFGGIGTDSKEIIYRIKATNTGTFIVPPIFGMAMYNARIKSIGVGQVISVTSNAR